MGITNASHTTHTTHTTHTQRLEDDLPSVADSGYGKGDALIRSVSVATKTRSR